MSDWLQVALFAAVVGFGIHIAGKLDRLPKSSKDPSFLPGFPDLWLIVETDIVMEDDFSVEYVDGWSVGRSFSAYGKPRLCDDWPDDLKPSSRVGIKINPTADWFSGSQIGHIRSYGERGLSVDVFLPYQLARQVLEDLRRNPRLRPSVNFKKVSTSRGDRYAVYGFELMDPEQ